ncbi:MAG: adenylate/guanylate cyclase domain-containing protein [Dehalococcoidia bacterium]
MEPRIQYAQTSDGANIAWWSLGDGPTVIQLPSIPFTHIQMEWDDPNWRGWYLTFGEGLRLIRYDSRGCGLSSAPTFDYCLNAMVQDLESVVERSGAEDVVLLAPVQSGPVALVYAARHPERVSRIILWCAVSRGDEMRTSSFEALRTLSHTDWALFAETAAHALVAGWDEAQVAHRMASIMRESSSAAIHDAVLEGFLNEDISDALAAVECPVLVAYRMQATTPLPASARYLASALRNASLHPVQGSSLLLVVSDADAIAASFREFLQSTTPTRTRPSAATGFQTLLFTDIEGHSAIIQVLGDERGRAVLREHERLTREVIREHHGVEVLARGDGFLVRFETAFDGIEAAADLQRRLADAAADLPVELRVRIGINAGEPIREGDELHGAVVKSTESIASMANGGEILVSNVVRELAAGKGYGFIARGEFPLAGLEEPIRVWEMQWAHSAS